MSFSACPPNVNMPTTGFSRASTAWEKLDSGVWREVAINVPRGNSNGFARAGSYTNRILNPLFVGATFHTGTPARLQPIVSSGVIAGFTILDGGTGYASPPTIQVNGSPGSGFVGAAVLTGGVITGVTISNGGTNYSASTGALVVGGSVPTSWTVVGDAGNFAGLSFVSASTVNGVPVLSVRFRGNSQGLYLRPSISDATASAGQVFSQSIFAKMTSSPDANLLYFGETYSEVGGSQRALSRPDFYYDNPIDLTFVENAGNLVPSGVTGVGTVQFFTWAVGTGAYDVTFALGAPFFGTTPYAINPVLPAPGTTGASTRAVESLVRPDFTGLFTSPGWGIAIDGYLGQGEGANARVLWQMDDGTDNNRITVRTVPNTSALVAEVAVAGSVIATTTASHAPLPDRRFRAFLTGAPTGLDLTVDGGATNAVTTTLPTVTNGREGNNVAGTLPLDGRIASVQFTQSRPTSTQKTEWSVTGVALGSATVGATANAPFSIVFLPDTHVTSGNSWEWQRIYNWITTNQSAHNIVCVVGEGDVITDAANAGLWAAEFDLALPGWAAFDTAGIPNIAGIGNHDYDTDASVSNRLSTRFESKLPLSRMSARSWFGGSYAGESKNSWIKFDVGTRKFLVLNLEIWPDDAMLAWGLGVCNANLDREVILITHAYLNPDGTVSKSTDPNGYANLSYQANDGVGVWAKLGKLAPNMKFIVSGHQIRANQAYAKTAYSLATGDNGNRVHQFFCNYQTVDGGYGMLGLLRLHTNRATGELCAYSALTNKPDPASVLSLTW